MKTSDTYLFSSESVSDGHPDKVADQISDALLDNFLAQDPKSKVACETLVTAGQVLIAGEITSDAYVDLQSVVRGVIADIGYTKGEYGFDAQSVGILSAIHEQSPDIHMGVVRETDEDQGAGDQGIMFGYASCESDNYMPLPIELAHSMLQILSQIRKEEPDLMPYLRPDAKGQVTLEYNMDRTPKRVNTIVLSTQHDDFVKLHDGMSQAQADRLMQEKISEDVRRIVIPRLIEKYSSKVQNLLDDQVRYLINPTGRFVLGGPAGDTGLTGRKIIVDTYGGRAAHGGGAFSGQDPSKVDRSATYAARYLAKNLVAAGVSDEIKIQVAYAIGQADPVSIYVNTYGRSRVRETDGEIASMLSSLFDLRPYHIIKSLHLKAPIYRESSAYGHIGRTPRVATKSFTDGNGRTLTKEVELFAWEKTDLVDKVRGAFHF
ncbi:MAG: methionine adenosyltransferase [Porphyromonas sp.]|uniref:methionine adenosyltransferase n=1 Tax=Porphyromonas sp. TaxID=1924944 RepID=UPI002A91C4BF|nr:methionine adenosyltransferase [Porphyromonas sp.]MDY6102779.1 methionine adenosyltransferase [Porphyromonas sp.]